MGEDIEVLRYTVKGPFFAVRRYHKRLLGSLDILRGRDITMTHDGGWWERNYTIRASRHNLNVIQLGMSMRDAYDYKGELEVMRHAVGA